MNVLSTVNGSLLFCYYISFVQVVVLAWQRCQRRGQIHPLYQQISYQCIHERFCSGWIDRCGDYPTIWSTFLGCMWGNNINWIKRTLIHSGCGQMKLILQEWTCLHWNIPSHFYCLTWSETVKAEWRRQVVFDDVLMPRLLRKKDPVKPSCSVGWWWQTWPAEIEGWCPLRVSHNANQLCQLLDL